ncbi:hypothetical protein ASD11_03380 [Aeromicrobium sp. Root495]|uniref:CDP-glycerol glycerophosphotransferase family protein n=1 Tax=Aeromicrobium sp. Root495 TaxID=1736550 RepID=UPI0006F890DF|nr:CDP-glycerol glycerophosphotransferase family protein [Aeromicrobium sp. Root495]KQY58705.1 hypothetical protein ASD11_03380 [Aeromicrobium sp. Root495]
MPVPSALSEFRATVLRRTRALPRLVKIVVLLLVLGAVGFAAVPHVVSGAIVLAVAVVGSLVLMRAGEELTDWTSIVLRVTTAFVALVSLVGALVRGDAAVAALLAGLLVAATALLATRRADTTIFAYGLDGVPDGKPRQPFFRSTWLSVAQATAAASVPLLTRVDDEAVAAVVGLVILLLVALAAVPTLVLDLRRERILRAVRARGTRSLLAYCGKSGAPSQLAMWEPYLLEADAKPVVVNLQRRYASLIIKRAGLHSPFVQLSRTGVRHDVSRLVSRRVKIVFYVQNARQNETFWRFKRATHVWLHHGDTDKPGNYHPRHVMYDKLIVAGPAAIDRYAKHGVDMPREKFVPIGRPQNWTIQKPERPIREIERPTVMYAPTWQGLDGEADFSSLALGPTIVKRLLERDVEVIFRAHPLSYRWSERREHIKAIHEILREDRERTGRLHRWGPKVERGLTVAECANRADALISDLCGVASDFLMSEKPYAIVATKDSVEDFREKYRFTQTGYVIRGDLGNLDEVFDDLLVNDPFEPERPATRRYVLGDLEGEALRDGFTHFVQDLLAPSTPSGR